MKKLPTQKEADNDETRKARLMIVDDELLVTDQVKDSLERLGYDVVGTANTGEGAIEMARDLLPDLILMDIKMPKADIDGITASRVIKQELEIPAVFITAFGGDQIIHQAKDVEAFGFLTKPFQDTELKATIEFALYRKVMDQRLRESEQRYRILVDTAIEVIITIDIHMNIVSWNRAAGLMFGYTTEEAVGQPFLSIIPKRFHKELQIEIDRMVLTEEWDPNVRTTQCIAHRKDNSEFPLEFSLASSLFKEEIFFTIIARDITERRKVEQMKSDFVSLVSHQLRTPVAGVLGCIDNMLNGITGDLKAKQIEYLKMMHDISKRNYRIISDLLNVSRIERGVISMNIHPVTIQEITDIVVQRFKTDIEEKGLKFILEGIDNSIEILVDKDKMIEAISNVVHNAFKFTQTGSITIRIKAVGDLAFIEVIDTGPGISVDVMQNLFRKDQILKGAPSVTGGCGLGLYIVKEFMKLMNSEIAVRSTVDKGSQFTFEIPLVNSKMSGKKRQIRPKKTKSRK